MNQDLWRRWEQYLLEHRKKRHQNKDEQAAPFAAFHELKGFEKPVKDMA